MNVDVPTIELLKTKTEQFFELHWKAEKLGKVPEWSDVVTDFKKIPNYNKRGIYAFVKGEEITYIGVGAGQVKNPLYANHGLSARISRYIGWIDEPNNIHGAKDEKLKDAGALTTLGFEPEQAYLSYALEMYLIHHLKPIHNKVGR